MRAGWQRGISSRRFAVFRVRVAPLPVSSIERLAGAEFALARDPGLNFRFKNMALTLDQVRKIANLARLRLTPEEEARFAEQLGRVVDYIDQLERFTPPAPPPESAAPSALPEAADAVAPCLPREAFLANAPAAIDGFLLVPEVKGAAEGESGA
jgi:aspartyl-tRNA(Asn)/glutamyl-tRNA(Gln) amidotransferase subunit C